MNQPFFNFAPLAGGNRLSGIKQAFSSAEQDAAKREKTVPVTLPTIGGKTYWRLSGLMHVNGVAREHRER